ncbi:MAG: hypothetical protein JJE04_00075 [Acidobacteriia bacterium]|nr:hypothetical protein [Terriglobia bacterium]
MEVRIMNVFPAAGLLTLLVLLAFWLVLRKAIAPGRGAIDFSRIQDFSVQDYRPLQRLLSEEDADFLRRQPGYEAAMGKRLARQRRAIYRSYLHSLCKDFELLHRAARLLAAAAPQDQPELTGALFKQSLRFYSTLALIQVQLAFHGAGMRPVSVDTGALIESAGWMRVQLQSMIPAPITAGAMR